MKSGKKTSGAEANGGSRSVKRLVGPGPDICKEALEDARQLLADIANHKVNPEDEAEKWLRAYGWPNAASEQQPEENA